MGYTKEEQYAILIKLATDITNCNNNFVVDGSIIAHLFCKSFRTINDIDLNYINTKENPKVIKKLIQEQCYQNNIRYRIFDNNNSIKINLIDNDNQVFSKINVKIKNCSVVKYKLKGHIIRGISKEELLSKKISAISTESEHIKIPKKRIKHIIDLHLLSKNIMFNTNDVLTTMDLYNINPKTIEYLKHHQNEINNLILEKVDLGTISDEIFFPKRAILISNPIVKRTPNLIWTKNGYENLNKFKPKTKAKDNDYQPSL